MSIPAIAIYSIQTDRWKASINDYMQKGYTYRILNHSIIFDVSLYPGEAPR